MSLPQLCVLRQEIFKFAVHLHVHICIQFPTTTPSSRNNHNVSYVKRHSRHILSVAISMLCSIRRPTITRDQGRTGAVINCIKLHLSCERKSEAKYIVTTIDYVNKSLNNADNVLRLLIDLNVEAIDNFIALIKNKIIIF